MAENSPLSPSEIRDHRAEHAGLRDRDFAEKFGISEAQLVAAWGGEGVTRIPSHPDDVMALAQSLGEVMALTRNISCVNEKVGVYGEYHTGQHAAMVLGEDIDLRMFPSHWCHAFLVEREDERGVRRSVQVFDAAGDAVHKIHLREGSDLGAWERARWDLAVDNQSPVLEVEPRKPVEVAKSAPEKLDVLRKEWARLTDTHQFLRLTSKLKMNRLSAYRIAGEPYVRALTSGSVDQMLNEVKASGIEVMVFVGNRGCIQIHSGPIGNLSPMGPWQNVMDPRFNLHLRLDHVAEVWAVNKPTQRGPAVSLEAFDADGALIFQVFGVGKKGRDSRPRWQKIVAGLESLQAEAV